MSNIGEERKDISVTISHGIGTTNSLKDSNVQCNARSRGGDRELQPPPQLMPERTSAKYWSLHFPQWSNKEPTFNLGPPVHFTPPPHPHFGASLDCPLQYPAYFWAQLVSLNRDRVWGPQQYPLTLKAPIAQCETFKFLVRNAVCMCTMLIFIQFKTGSWK